MDEFRNILCTECGVTNRLPVDMAGKHAKCGKCGVPLPEPLSEKYPDHPLAVGEGDFHGEVLNSPLPVLVDFWAHWCGPCRSMTPILETIAREYSGRLKVVKVNTEENRQLARRFEIQAIPTLMLFHQGKLKEQFVGALPVQQLRNWIGKGMGWL